VGVEYDIILLDTLLCWHFIVSVVVIQHFMESVTCLILCHIYLKKFGCGPFVKRMIQLSLRLTIRQDVILSLICAICAVP
jgi:hypothetical protein